LMRAGKRRKSTVGHIKIIKNCGRGGQGKKVSKNLTNCRGEIVGGSCLGKNRKKEKLPAPLDQEQEKRTPQIMGGKGDGGLTQPPKAQKKVGYWGASYYRKNKKKTHKTVRSWMGRTNCGNIVKHGKS